MTRKTFLQKGIPYASELALRNVNDLERVVDWNAGNQLSLYRMSSDMFPWMSEYEFDQLPDYREILQQLQSVGAKARSFGMRLTFHPGPFNVLATTNDAVLVKTIKELRQHGEIMDMLGMPRSPFSKINIHVGAAYGDRSAAITRFIKNFSRLPLTASSRLTVENDDKPNMFSVGDLIHIHEETGIPIVFDYHHHTFRTGDLTSEEAMRLAFDTWPRGITPIVHFSSSRKIFEDPLAPATAHADFIHEPIDLYGLNAAVMLEAKAKEQAALRFRSVNKIDAYFIVSVG